MIIVMALAIVVSSCNKSDDDVSPSTVNSTFQNGKWKVANYNDSGNDETSHFTGYEFEFASGGSLTAVKSGNTVTGTWSTGSDDSQTKIYIAFGSVTPFDELNDDWKVVDKTSSIINLEDVSGGNGGTDYLRFEKL